MPRAVCGSRHVRSKSWCRDRRVRPPPTRLPGTPRPARHEPGPPPHATRGTALPHSVADALSAPSVCRPGPLGRARDRRARRHCRNNVVLLSPVTAVDGALRQSIPARDVPARSGVHGVRPPVAALYGATDRRGPSTPAVASPGTSVTTRSRRVRRDPLGLRRGDAGRPGRGGRSRVRHGSSAGRRPRRSRRRGSRRGKSCRAGPPPGRR